MATKYVCDRCHAEFLSDFQVKRLIVPETSHDHEISMDLCESCVIQLRSFVDPLPRAVPRPFYDTPSPQVAPPGPVTCDLAVAEASPSEENKPVFFGGDPDDDTPF